ncbi:MAG: hypothetical protein A3G33_00625 [Omnitrophica bacterium RIFCSPLOWO2_12_FULL_44_17]|uniref:Glycosyltransferase RgtA/B/C/D-like domain-containing protein n=1 Tax=Candidatus Danuiimicrobium aquiferis TaxID=1801832 RepID=A0A1G1L2C1_9BACT|nr:MAG: hypothetical protein A3E74_07820 [Omnitrophica bacterium RIFCSPHIGHO2_12_FULL_44_12]OGW99312.1 MAG: hypothetical protein A3G33_00625 [Omnitrophica bacterium RIFCSPLOWO2_12_FULL_44_17]OGX04909.1 MAG: hypothetical protein A3J12_04485 [Omnitrophica bacterium RIFCSPLOWO2_02_FULL_44_11]
MKKQICIYTLFAIGVIFLFSFWIGKIPLYSSDEGRYGEIAREMWENKNFVIPTFNYSSYLDKPILAPFLTALSFSMFGINEISVRLVPILAAIFGILMTFLFTKIIFDRTIAHYAALLLLTTVGYVLVGRFGVIDMLMTFFLSGSMFCLMHAYFNRRTKYYLLAYAFMGFAFLTKGMIGFVLPGLIFLAFLTWTKNLKEIGKMHLVWGVLIVAVIILPWFVAACLKESEFFDIFIVKQQFTRFLKGGFGRRKPFWFFAPILIATSFPWSLFLPATLINSFRKENPYQKAMKFLICWVGVIFIFFSLPKSKLPYYLLPASVPFAVLIAVFLADWVHGKEASRLVSVVMKWTWRVLFGICSLAVTGLFVYLLFWKQDPQTATLRPVLQAVGVTVLAGSTLAYFFQRIDRRKNAVTALAGMIFITLLVTFVGMKKIGPFQSSFAYAEVLNSKLQSGDMLAVYASPDEFSDIPFYLKRRVVVVGPDKGTLTYEADEPDHAEENKKWFISREQMVSIFNENQVRVYCLMEQDKFQDLLNIGIKNYRILKEGFGKLLISNVSDEAQKPF